MPAQAGFSKSVRLLDAKAYTFVFDKAQRFNLSAGLYLVRANSQATARLGLVVAKKRLNKAVKRNHLKRAQREHFRLVRPQLNAYDIVFLANHHLTKLNRRQMTLCCVKDWLKLSVLLST